MTSEPEDTCRPVEVDGQTIRVHGAREMTEEDRGHFANIVRAAQAHMAKLESAKSIRTELDTLVAPANICKALTAAGWVYSGPDAELVTRLLADPHRNMHILDLTTTGWALQHPLAERINSDLFSCPLNTQGERFEQAFNLLGPGQYHVEYEAGEVAIHHLPAPTT